MPKGSSFATISKAALPRLLWLGIIALGVVTLLSLFARSSWFCELFSHFTLQLGRSLAILLIGALLLRRWWASILALVLLIPHGINASYYYPHTDEVDSSRPDFTVISFNVLTANNQFEDVRKYLLSIDPDLILLMEVDRRWLAALEELDHHYPHSLKGPREDNFGMALFSKHPIDSHTLTKVEGSGVPCLHAVLTIDGRQLEVIGAHPIPPMGPARARSRNEYLQAVAERVEKARSPTLVLGDFNCTPWSPFFRDLIDETGLIDSGKKRGNQSTWRRGNLLFSIPIDHVLHSSDLSCTSRTISPNLGSDHHPIHTRFRFLSPRP